MNEEPTKCPYCGAKEEQHTGGYWRWECQTMRFDTKTAQSFKCMEGLLAAKDARIGVLEAALIEIKNRYTPSHSEIIDELDGEAGNYDNPKWVDANSSRVLAEIAIKALTHDDNGN